MSTTMEGDRMCYQGGGARPALLMFSHCLPDAVGTPQRARAWELLWLATQSHDVHLVTLADAPISLMQWSALRQRTDNLVIASRADAPVAIDAWSGQVDFEAVMCTHPVLWTMVERLETALSICDIHAPTGQMRHGSTRSSLFRADWWGLRRTRIRREIERRIARQCHVVTLSHESDRRLFEDEPCRIMVLRGGIDLSYYRQAQAEPCAAPTPRLLLHLDTDGREKQKCIDAFNRNVWPKVQRAVPEARLDCTAAQMTRQTVAALRDAAVVAAPLTQPARARFPVLQAMAMNRPVIAPAAAMADEQVRHGEHLLMANRIDDWVDCCVQCLRSAQMRMQLARGARTFVEHHCPIEQTGRSLLQLLRQGTAPSQPGPLKLAA